MSFDPSGSHRPEPEALPGWLLVAWAVDGNPARAARGGRDPARSARRERGLACPTGPRSPTTGSRSRSARSATGDDEVHRLGAARERAGPGHSRSGASPVRHVLERGRRETAARRTGIAVGGLRRPGPARRPAKDDPRRTGVAPVRDAAEDRHAVVVRADSAGTAPTLSPRGRRARRRGIGSNGRSRVARRRRPARVRGRVFPRAGAIRASASSSSFRNGRPLLVVAPAETGASTGAGLPAARLRPLDVRGRRPAGPRGGRRVLRRPRPPRPGRRPPDAGDRLGRRRRGGPRRGPARSSRRHTLWILAAAAAVLRPPSSALGLRLAARRCRPASLPAAWPSRDARYRVLLEQTQEAVAVAVDGRVAYANPACVEMFGYQKSARRRARHDLLRSGLARAGRGDRPPPRSRAGPRPSSTRPVGLRGDGTTFAVELRVTPIDFEGQPASQAILRDITGRKRMEAEAARIRGALPPALRAQPRRRLSLDAATGGSSSATAPSPR